MSQAKSEQKCTLKQLKSDNIANFIQHFILPLPRKENDVSTFLCMTEKGRKKN